MKTLSEADSQIVLYAKNHFHRGDDTLLEDMRLLVGRRTGVDPKHINDRDIVCVISGLLMELGLPVAHPSFMEEAVCGSRFMTTLHAVKLEPVERFLHAAMHLLLDMRVKDGDRVLVDLKPKDAALQAIFDEKEVNNG